MSEAAEATEEAVTRDLGDGLVWIERHREYVLDRRRWHTEHVVYWALPRVDDGRNHLNGVGGSLIGAIEQAEFVRRAHAIEAPVIVDPEIAEHHAVVTPEVHMRRDFGRAEKAEAALAKCEKERDGARAEYGRLEAAIRFVSDDIPPLPIHDMASVMKWFQVEVLTGRWRPPEFNWRPAGAGILPGQ